MHRDTKVLHCGPSPASTVGTVSKEHPGSRTSPQDAVAAALAELEEGTCALLFGSGMAAINCLLSLCNGGDRVVVAGDMCAGVNRALEKVFRRFFIMDRSIDLSDAQALQDAVHASRLLLLKSPADPVLQVADIRATVATAHAAGCLVAVDNSAMTGYLQRPLTLGADVVVYSSNGHLCGDRGISSGALVLRDRALAQGLQIIAEATGSGLDPLSAWCLLAGLRTLGVRMTRQQANAETIAKAMIGRDWVRRVHYPGLAEHPGHAMQARQAEGFGSLVALDVGERVFAERLASNLQFFTQDDVCGAVESVVSLPRPAVQTAARAAQSQESRSSEGVLRLSIGLEHPADLVEDLDRAARASLSAPGT